MFLISSRLLIIEPANASSTHRNQSECQSATRECLGNRRRGFLSKALKAMRAKDKEQLMLALDKRSQSRLHRCGGPVSGLFLTQTPDQPELRMQDDEFITAAQWRLGALTPHSDAKCRLRDAEDRICNQAMDNHCDHGATCKVGRGVLRTHNAVA